MIILLVEVVRGIVAAVVATIVMSGLIEVSDNFRKR
jgi:hypothetical protein